MDSSRDMSLECKWILNTGLTCNPVLFFLEIAILIVKQPSASVKPVMSQGSNRGFTALLRVCCSLLK